jgi:hypothetical protein
MLESLPQNKNSRRLCRDSSPCSPRLRLRWLFRNAIVFHRFGVYSMVGKYEVGAFDASLTAFSTSLSIMIGYTPLRDSMINLTYRC